MSRTGDRPNRGQIKNPVTGSQAPGARKGCTRPVPNIFVPRPEPDHRLLLERLNLTLLAQLPTARLISGLSQNIGSRSLEAVLPGTDKKEDDHDAEHLNRVRVLNEIVRMLAKGRSERNDHREGNQCSRGSK
jgi:hypothetical protein